MRKDHGRHCGSCYDVLNDWHRSNVERCSRNVRIHARRSNVRHCWCNVLFTWRSSIAGHCWCARLNDWCKSNAGRCKRTQLQAECTHPRAQEQRKTLRELVRYTSRREQELRWATRPMLALLLATVAKGCDAATSLLHNSSQRRSGSADTNVPGFAGTGAKCYHRRCAEPNVRGHGQNCDAKSHGRPNHETFHTCASPWPCKPTWVNELPPRRFDPLVFRLPTRRGGNLTFPCNDDNPTLVYRWL